uniref:Uncharacterized protein n=1 Tax=Timema shepardi TaxID=629360 RepID=A0A7R9G529_TIMSH|nr:unnamed protein product [Timema shepardi]
MHGARRVITFCLLTAVLPTILLITPLYLRHSVFADVTFAVAESDVVEIVDGISTIFCQAQSLKMNTSFHSFQLGSLPERSGKRKHLHLKKSMVIPDDTLEYWGFFLPKGSTVVLSACSRYVGSRLLVVKGEKNLRTCGLMDQNEEEVLAHMASNHGQVRITFETQAQEIHEGHKLSFTNKHSLTLGDYPKISSTLSPLQVDSTSRAQYSGLQSSTKTLKEKQETHKDAEAVSYIDENTAYEQDDDDDDYVNDNAGIGHGGNAVIVNVTTMPDEAKEESDVSSFENDLLTCYDGNILLHNPFLPSVNCTGQHMLEDNQQKTFETTHNVLADGYYYYIFYSDNDFVLNDVHATFDIFKPTYQYANFTKGENTLSTPAKELNPDLTFTSNPVYCESNAFPCDH